MGREEPFFDRRTQGDLEEEMSALARAFLPQWRMEGETGGEVSVFGGDIGRGLEKLYQKLFFWIQEDLEKSFSRNREAFFQMTDTEEDGDFRIVTEQDYERLAQKILPDLSRAVSFGGIDGNGEARAGAVTLAIQAGEGFERARETILSRLKEKGAGLLQEQRQVFVVAPRMILVSVKAHLLVKGDPEAAKKGAKEALARYLDNSRWEMGQIPGYAGIQSLLWGLPGIVYVEKLQIILEEEGRGILLGQELKTLEKLPWKLPVSGTHQITAKAEN